MLNNLLPNLQIIGILLVAYAASLGVNTILGIYYNIDIIKQQFSWKKFWSGIIRGGILLAAAALITVILSCLPSVLESFGITTSDEHLGSSDKYPLISPSFRLIKQEKSSSSARNRSSSSEDRGSSTDPSEKLLSISGSNPTAVRRIIRASEALISPSPS